jgi:hypothetical protein
VFCIESTKDFVERIDDESRQFKRQFSKESVPKFQFRTETVQSRVSPEVTVPEQLTATAIVRNQKTSHWFLCYESVK